MPPRCKQRDDSDVYKAARMLHLLRLLYHDRPRTQAELARRLGTCVETVRRYIQEMEGPPLYVPFVRTAAGWSLLTGWRF